MNEFSSVVIGMSELILFCLILAVLLELLDKAFNSLWVKWNSYITRKASNAIIKEKDRWQKQLAEHDNKLDSEYKECQAPKL